VNVAVAVEEGNVYLRGRVPSYFLKQKAQETVLAVAGIKRVSNELDVIGLSPSINDRYSRREG
jgi:osmotically-inducible protein OsmY